MSHDQSSVDREIALQRAFDAAAEDLDLQMVKGPSGAEEPRMVGALAPAAHTTSDVDDANMPISAENDDDAIAAVVEKWETTDIDKLVETAKEVLHEPYAIIKPVVEDGNVAHNVQVVDQKFFEQWVNSDTFKELATKFEVKDPREVEISGLSITYLGPVNASVTYKTRESGAKGTYISNAGAFMVKENGTWYYIAMTRSVEVS